MSESAKPNSSGAHLPPELANHPKYRILRELGRGGMGVVYQARHKEMDRQVVIKVINRALLERHGALERFHRLYDMHGLVWEWCDDGKRRYTDEVESDPVGAGASRAIRGGSFLRRIDVFL